MASTLINLLRDATRNRKPVSSAFANSLRDMLAHNWYLGITSFGGPAVHFQIFRKLFVEKLEWLDLQMYQELFALCQALPGPGSTKMHYCINVIHCGFIVGFISFLIWSLPGAIAAYGLSLGIARINKDLPHPVNALLTGLNSATVGIIALAAVQLSQKTITDKLTRILVFLGASAGMLYNALWYFPVLMIAGGCATVVWDYRWLHNLLKGIRHKMRPKQSIEQENADVEATQLEDLGQMSRTGTSTAARPASASPAGLQTDVAQSTSVNTMNRKPANDATERDVTSQTTEAFNKPVFSWKFGILVIACFFVSFVVIMALHGVLHSNSRGFNLFVNLYLAGTIIFGGGPVVIPLLREYVVAEGWVSPRDFLLGLAIIQAYPGPNFNFAVYLGALAAVSSGSLNSAAGATIGYVAIFSPGLILHTGFMGLWKTFRRYRWFTSCLRGVNASAVGLVYTAVYRLWEIGYIDATYQGGSPLGSDPWWVVVTATSFVGGMWFDIPPPIAILLGGVMGMIWYGVVTA